MNKRNDNIITYKNDKNIKKHVKKISLKKVFRDGGVTGILAFLTANSGIIKTLVPISTYLTGHGAVDLAYKAGELTANGQKILGELYKLIAHGSISTISLLQWISLNPTLAATAIGAIVGAGGMLISAVARFKGSKKGTIEKVKSMSK